MVDSRDKGRTYEYKIRDLLTEELGIKFNRTPLSGALAYAKGDLFTFDNFDWCIECKHYAELPWNNLLTAKTNDLYTFWAQAKQAASMMKKEPIVIFRWNRSRDYALWTKHWDCDSQINVKAFGQDFKIALLSDWITKYKEFNVK